MPSLWQRMDEEEAGAPEGVPELQTAEVGHCRLGGCQNKSTAGGQVQTGILDRIRLQLRSLRPRMAKVKTHPDSRPLKERRRAGTTNAGAAGRLAGGGEAEGEGLKC